VALAVGVAAGMLNWTTKARLREDTDLEQVLVAARALSHGSNPYGVVGPGLLYDSPWPLLYPLPAVMTVLAVSTPALPFGMGAACFVFLGAVAFSYALTKDGWQRLPMLLSVPAIWAFSWAQWSPILSAAMVLPWLGFAFAAKPTIGIALFAARPNRKAFASAVAITVVALVLLPRWPEEWVAAVRSANLDHFIVPLRFPSALLLLLGLVRWRRPEARLLILLACVPQSPTFYDTLPLAFVPATRFESLTLALLTYVATAISFAVYKPPLLADFARGSGPATVALVYLPCLIMILRRPNEGSVPAWVDRGAARVSSTLSHWPPTRRAMGITSALMQYGSDRISLRRPRSGAS
jgi:hypothetical protein